MPHSPLTRTHIVTVLLVFTIAFQIAHYYPLLPERVASHFDASGRPNGWSPRGAFFGLYAVTIAITVLIFAVSPVALARVPSSWVSLPGKEFWLSPERRERTFAFLRSQMGMFCNAALVFTLCMFQLAIQANLSRGKGFDVVLMLVLLVAYLLFTMWWTVRLIRRFRRVREPLP